MRWCQGDLLTKQASRPTSRSLLSLHALSIRVFLQARLLFWLSQLYGVNSLLPIKLTVMCVRVFWSLTWWQKALHEELIAVTDHLKAVTEWKTLPSLSVLFFFLPKCWKTWFLKMKDVPAWAHGIHNTSTAVLSCCKANGLQTYEA